VRRGGELTVVSEGGVITWSELGKYWSRGFVFSQVAIAPVQKYLKKYFMKDYERLEGYNSEWGKLRRFGASRMFYFSYPKWAFEKISPVVDVSSDWVVNKVSRGVTLMSCDAATEEWSSYSWRSPWRLVR
jgi:hypothetical protein